MSKARRCAGFPRGNVERGHGEGGGCDPRRGSHQRRLCGLLCTLRDPRLCARPAGTLPARNGSGRPDHPAPQQADLQSPVVRSAPGVTRGLVESPFEKAGSPSQKKGFPCRSAPWRPPAPSVCRATGNNGDFPGEAGSAAVVSRPSLPGPPRGTGGPGLPAECRDDRFAHVRANGDQEPSSPDLLKTTFRASAVAVNSQYFDAWALSTCPRRSVGCLMAHRPCHSSVACTRNAAWV